MKIFSKSLVIMCLLSITNVLMAQHNICGTDQYMAEMLKANPQLLKSISDYNDGISKASDFDIRLNKKGVTRTIPVVFHVIHTYGAENISKAQIEDQMRILNEDFSFKVLPEI